MSDASNFLQLLRKMGHDMRVPLNTLISTTDMLVEGIYDPLTAKQNRAAVRLQRNSHRLLAMLDDFVTYVKADAKELEVSRNPFDGRLALEDCCNQVRSAAEEKGLALQLVTSESVPAMLVGDETLVKRIVVALLWNATAYTEQGEIRVTSDWTEAQGWQVCVQDTGCGIPDADLPHLFEPFWRGEARPQVPTAGAGLGLPLSLALAKLMDGDLFLKETSAQGSTFCLYLPVK